jgi:hypothetical protein
MWLLRSVVLVLAVFVTACGNETQPPTAPTPPQTQAPASVGKLVPFWDAHSERENCTSTGDCYWGEAIQNTGTGCASGATAVLRLSSGDLSQYDLPSFQMDALGGGLAAKLIRPNEIVPILSADRVPSNVASSAKWYKYDLTWNTVTCP